MPGPLDGIRVIDLATPRAELAGRLLADLGAEVIKVEPPEGAPARRLPPFTDGREGDPDGSLYWAAVALGKRSVTLDLATDAGRDALRALVASADVFIESEDPGALAAAGLDADALCALNPGLVYASITPYGQAGPKAAWPATELTVEAAGGLVQLQGDGDRPPIPLGFPQAAFHAGAQAAADIVIALNERERSGRGQRLDTSMQEAMVWTLLSATGYPPNTGGDPPRSGEQRVMEVEALPGLTQRAIGLRPCADGWVLTQTAGATGPRLLRAVIDHAIAAGRAPAAPNGVAWEDWWASAGEGVAVDEYLALLHAVFDEIRHMTKRELFDLAVRDDFMLAPSYTVADLRADPQFAARGFWTEVGGRVHPGAPALLSRTPIALRPAPALGEANALLDAPPAPLAPRPATAERSGEAFAGLKVADFAWIGVGPITSKALGDHGATVVHIESARRPDLLRTIPPFKDNVPGLDRAQFFANFNSSKLSLALDFSSPEGRTLARRMIDWADVVVESFTPGTMARLGLDYETVSRDRPELIMVSTCLRGQTGPHASYAGYGQHGAAIAGLHAITGWPDRPPAGPHGAYSDLIAPRYLVAALAAALLERRRSGLGQHIDLSQVEAAAHFIEPLILDYTVNGRVAGPRGHDSDTACPHGVYATRGVERYIAIAVETAGQWRALRALAPLDAFADPAFDALAARHAQREAIDAALRAWCAGQDGWALERTLAEAGVPVSVAARPSDLYRDPQLAARGFFVTLDHPVMGPTPYDGFATHFSARAETLRAPAPALGQHTAYVLRELLGLSGAEYEHYERAGVLR